MRWVFAGYIAALVTVLALAALAFPPWYGLVTVGVCLPVLLLGLLLAESAKRRRRVSRLAEFLVEAMPCVALALLIGVALLRLRAG